MKTETEIARARHRNIWIALIVLAVVALVAAFFLDATIATWITAHSSPGLKRIMRFVSRVGDWPAHVIAGVIGMAIAFALKNKTWTQIFFAMLIACALAGVSARVIKIATGRARPSVNTESTWNGPDLGSKYNAFPSGHTASSTAFFTVLFVARKKIGAPLLVIPIVIAASRMIVGAHYLSDITSAAILGAVCGLLVAQLFLFRKQKSEIKN